MFSTPAYAQAAGGAAASGGMTAILVNIAPLIFMIAIFWFLVIRPQQQRVKAHRAMIDAVKKGDEVVTGGGLVGKVFKVSDQEVEIDLSPTVRVKALKSTLSSVTPRGVAAPANDAKA
jgi:preprotein translocase subunit YajC